MKSEYLEELSFILCQTLNDFYQDDRNHGILYQFDFKIIRYFLNSNGESLFEFSSKISSYPHKKNLIILKLNLSKWEVKDITNIKLCALRNLEDVGSIVKQNFRNYRIKNILEMDKLSMG